jgi:predicted amidohydrolase YtcJ
MLYIWFDRQTKEGDMSGKRGTNGIALMGCDVIETGNYSRREFLKFTLAGSVGGLLFASGMDGSYELRKAQAQAVGQGQIQTTVLPGLADRHTHTSLYIALLGCDSLWGVESKAAAKELIEKSPADKISMIRGWNSNYYAFTADDLEKMPPVIIVHYSLHLILMSKAAEAIIKEDHPEIVANYKNLDWYERNIAKILMFLGSIPEISEDLVEKHFNDLSYSGVEYVEDMLAVSESAIRRIKSSSMGDRASFWASMDLYETLPLDLMTEVKGIKLFIDGGLGGRTAAMSKVYRNTDNKGLLCYEDKALLELMRRTAEMGKSLSLHAIGDRALDQVISNIGRIKSEGLSFPVLRIEHAMFINRKQAEEMKAAGATLSMQPVFSDDSVDYGSILPEGYPEKNNPFRMLIDDVGFKPGEDLIFSSDGMPHGIEPSLNLSLFPPFKGQELTLDEFIKGYTRPTEQRKLVVRIDHGAKQVNLIRPAEMREAI